MFKSLGQKLLSQVKSITSNKRYVKYVVIGVVSLSVLIGVTAKLLSDNKNDSNNNMQYALAEVQKGDIQVTASGSGSIAASVRKEIMTLTSGIVDTIYVEEGQSVEEGDLILAFESESESSVLERAQLDVSIAENSLRELQTDLQNLKVYATAAGVVGDIDVNVGEELSKGYILTTITDKSNIEVTGLFNGLQVNSINVGDNATVLLVESMQTVSGKVAKVNQAPSDNDGAVLYGVTVEVDNPGGLTSGMSAQVTVYNSKGEFPAVTGTELEAETPYNVKLLTGGIIKNIHVSSGDYVEKGELLAELESTNLQTQIDSQRLRVEQNRSALNETIEDLDNTVVYAPISGMLTAVNVTKGERVGEDTAVAVVSDLKNLEVVIPVDELDVADVQVGQEAVISVEAMPEMKYSANVSKIAPEGSTSGGVATFDVTLRLNDIAGLKPGMTANVEIITAKKENILVLPVAAVQQQGNKRFVLTGDEKLVQQGQPIVTPVSIGLVSEEYVEITKGLSEGDQVYYPLVGMGNTQFQQGAPGMGMVRIGGGGPAPANRRER